MVVSGFLLMTTQGSSASLLSATQAHNIQTIGLRTGKRANLVPSLSNSEKTSKQIAY